MGYEIVSSALVLSALVALKGALSIALGGALAGVLRVVTQIDDRAIAYAGRLGGLLFFCYFLGAGVWRDILAFSGRVWGGPDFYF